MGLSFSPLADATVRPRDLLDIDRIRIQLDSAIRGASSLAISRLLGAVMAQKQMELDELERSVAERALRATEALYEKEHATQAAYTAAKNALRARSHELRLSRLAAERTLELLGQAVALPAGQLGLRTLEELRLGSFAGRAAGLVGSADAEAVEAEARDAPLRA